jgi:very-short-patch-repair endonuclease
MAHNIVIGQRIDASKKAIAKELRRNMTPAEKALWNAVRRNQLNGYHFRRQQIVSGFIVDFYCHAAALVVEVDGAVHLEMIEADAERDAILMAHDMRILRFKNAEVLRNLRSVLNRIAANLTPQPPSLRGKGEPRSGH